MVSSMNKTRQHSLREQIADFLDDATLAEEQVPSKSSTHFSQAATNDLLRAIVAQNEIMIALEEDIVSLLSTGSSK